MKKLSIISLVVLVIGVITGSVNIILENNFLDTITTICIGSSLTVLGSVLAFANTEKAPTVIVWIGVFITALFFGSMVTTLTSPDTSRMEWKVAQAVHEQSANITRMVAGCAIVGLILIRMILKKTNRLVNID
jgi:hypothetical protein